MGKKNKPRPQDEKRPEQWNEGRVRALQKGTRRIMAIIQELVRVRTALDKIKKDRPIQDELVSRVFAEMRKEKPDLELVERLEQRLNIEIGDLNAKIERIDRIVNEQIGFMSQGELIGKANFEKAKTAFEAVKAMDEQILEEIAKKRKARGKYWKS